MKRVLAFLLVISMLVVATVSCDSNSTQDGSDNRDFSDDTTTDDSQDTEDSDDSSKESSETEKKTYPNDAELIGYCTEDSLYNGEFNSSVGWKAAGMGYIVKTGDGKLIAIDGGNSCDAGAFYDLLAENYSKGETPVIDYWILTHPHGDHIGAFLSMANDQSVISNIVIKNVVYYFPKGFNDATVSTYIGEVERAIKSFRARAVTPKKTRGITLDDVSVDFLYIPTDYLNLNNINQLSLIFTVTAKKKVMITGDAYSNSLVKVADQYGKRLKSDIIQMPHHFLCDTGYKAFYDFVGADTLLLPTCISGYEAMTNENSEYRNDTEFKLHKNMLSQAREVYKAFDGNFKIKI